MHASKSACIYMFMLLITSKRKTKKHASKTDCKKSFDTLPNILLATAADASEARLPIG